jgi:hypothetical protein
MWRWCVGWRSRPSSVSAVLFSILLLAQLHWSSPSWAWTLEGHRLIALDALAVLPPPMRDALAPHVSVILAGVVEPDFNRVVSHKIQIISLRGTPQPPRSGAADAFQRFATNAEEILRLGFLAEPSPYMQPLLLGNGHQPLNAMTTFVMEPRWAPEETEVEGLGERIGSGREDYEMKDVPTRTSRTRPSMPSDLD